MPHFELTIKGECELVLVSGGTFIMGSPETEKGHSRSESPLHKVTIQDFYLGKYPVTNTQYEQFLIKNPKVPEPEYWADRSFNQPNYPVVGVSWHEAKLFVEWAGGRLPSESEWEYACRAGTDKSYNLGGVDDYKNHLIMAGWFLDNSYGRLHPVGEKRPNHFGLYDMHGNVSEWCEDDWHNGYKNAPKNNLPWIDQPRNAYRILRGGSWISDRKSCRSASRSMAKPEYRNCLIGFRIALFAKTLFANETKEEQCHEKEKT